MRFTDPTVLAAPRPYHGLGNRVRSTLGSLSLAEWTGRDFAYSWPTGSSFGARFDELWEFPYRRVAPLASRLLSIRHPYRDAELGWMDDAADDRVWQIRTAHALHLPSGAVPWGARFRALVPVAAVAERITAFHERHLAAEPYVAVMVRAHAVSHAATLEHSPLEWYITRMQELRRTRPDVRFFVSADTPEAQQAVMEAVPNVRAQVDKGAYNSLAALQSSVVDLYLLASGGHIIGPHFSSFPEMAQQLAGDRVRLETSMTPDAERFGVDDVLTGVTNPLQPSGDHAI